MAGDHSKEVTEAYAAWAASYDQLMRRTYQRVERALSHAHLLRHFPVDQNARLLDAGGGDGARSVELLSARRAGAAVVLDLSSDMLRLAARRARWADLPLHLLTGDVCALPSPPAAFDLSISLGGVISHCRDFTRAIRELHRVTRPGGHIAISVDGRAVGIRTATRARSPELLTTILTRGSARAFHHPTFPFEVHFFSPEEFREELLACGLEILSLIGKPVFTHFLNPGEVLSRDEVEERVAMALPFVGDPGFLPYADQLEAVCRVP
jgi:ubiquinone/menaquinone biosynthesis C-methylase UbiE